MHKLVAVNNHQTKNPLTIQTYEWLTAQSPYENPLLNKLENLTEQETIRLKNDVFKKLYQNATNLDLARLHEFINRTMTNPVVGNRLEIETLADEFVTTNTHLLHIPNLSQHDRVRLLYNGLIRPYDKIHCHMGDLMDNNQKIHEDPALYNLFLMALFIGRGNKNTLDDIFSSNKTTFDGDDIYLEGRSGIRGTHEHHNIMLRTSAHRIMDILQAVSQIPGVESFGFEAEVSYTEKKQLTFYLFELRDQKEKLVDYSEDKKGHVLFKSPHLIGTIEYPRVTDDDSPLAALEIITNPDSTDPQNSLIAGEELIKFLKGLEAQLIVNQYRMTPFKLSEYIKKCGEEYTLQGNYDLSSTPHIEHVGQEIRLGLRGIQVTIKCKPENVASVIRTFNRSELFDTRKETPEERQHIYDIEEKIIEMVNDMPQALFEKAHLSSDEIAKFKGYLISLLLITELINLNPEKVYIRQFRNPYTEDFCDKLIKSQPGRQLQPFFDKCPDLLIDTLVFIHNESQKLAFPN